MNVRTTDPRRMQHLVLRWSIAALLVAVAGCGNDRGNAGERTGNVGAEGRSDAAAREGAAAAGATSDFALRVNAPPGEPAASFPTPSRPIAGIVAPRWTNEDARDNAGEFGRVVGAAGITAGMHVADIGAGDGYYAVRLAPLVGDSGTVYAEDVVPDYVRLLEDRIRRDGFRNVRLTQGEQHDPRLPGDALDVVLMIHMYHEIVQPFGLLYNLAPSFRPNGRLVILDLDRPTFGHGTRPALLRCELAAAGYSEVSFTRWGTEEFIAVFAPPLPDARPSPGAIATTLAAAPCSTSEP